MSHGYLCCFSTPYRPGKVNLLLCRASEQPYHRMWDFINNDVKVGGLTLPIKIEFVKVVPNTYSESFISSVNNMLGRLRPSGENGIFCETPQKIAQEFDLIEGEYWEC